MTNFYNFSKTSIRMFIAIFVCTFYWGTAVHSVDPNLERGISHAATTHKQSIGETKMHMFVGSILCGDTNDTYFNYLLPTTNKKGVDQDGLDRGLHAAANVGRYDHIRRIMDPNLSIKPSEKGYGAAMSECALNNDGKCADTLIQSCRKCYPDDLLKGFLFLSVKIEQSNFAQVIGQHLDSKI